VSADFVSTPLEELPDDPPDTKMRGVLKTHARKKAEKERLKKADA